MDVRVLARAAKARLLRTAGRPDRPVERHPDGMQLQPSDLGSVRARAAPLQLARMNGAFSNGRAGKKPRGPNCASYWLLSKATTSPMNPGVGILARSCKARVCTPNRRRGIPVTVLSDLKNQRPVRL